MSLYVDGPWYKHNYPGMGQILIRLALSEITAMTIVDRDIVTWWRHQMETFSALLAICAGNSPVPGQWRGVLMFSLICVWINGGVNNRESGDLRRDRAHYVVIIMTRNVVINEHNGDKFQFQYVCKSRCLKTLLLPQCEPFTKPTTERIISCI